jgi:acyl-CoA reductase-like NAD-dependent aldehyde dehydrogenase
VQEALDRAAAVFADRSKWLSVPERIAILAKFKKLVEANQDKLVQQAIAEGGKPLMDTKVEVARAIGGIQVAIETIPHLLGREIPMRQNAASMNRMAYTYREAGGLVSAISAFNHPINLIIHQVIPAIAVGCPVVIKPASRTPLSCLSLIELLHQSGLPKEWCQAVVCSNEDAELLVTDRRLSFLTFIGSAKVGWALRSKLAAGANCALEHGGVAPVIVEADANIEEAVPLLVKAGFYHAGQVCVSVQRVYAHESLALKLAAAGGSGGGGNGGTGTSGNGVAGTTNLGGGGGGGGNGSTGLGGNGGSGVVIISYSSNYKLATYTGTCTQTTSGGNYIFTFTGSGTITF